MSYILEALRRADAERQRGGVPGLHAQPAAPALSSTGPARHLGPAVLGLGAVGLLLAGGVVAWWLGAGRGGAAATAPGVTLPAPTIAQTVPSGAPVSANVGTPVGVPATAPASAPPLVPSNAPAGPAAAPLAVPAAPQVGLASATPRRQPPGQPPLGAQPGLPTAPPAAANGQGSVVAAPPAGGVAAPVPAATPANLAAPARVPRLAELPDSLRRELPALSLGGSVFADQPAARIVIINGQVFREGERPAPGLLVQQIGLRAVIFEFHGQRFEVPL